LALGLDDWEESHLFQERKKPVCFTRRRHLSGKKNVGWDYNSSMSPGGESRAGRQNRLRRSNWSLPRVFKPTVQSGEHPSQDQERGPEKKTKMRENPQKKYHCGVDEGIRRDWHAGCGGKWGGGGQFQRVTLCITRTRGSRGRRTYRG